MRKVQGSNLLELALTSFQDSRITVLPTFLFQNQTSNRKDQSFIFDF